MTVNETNFKLICIYNNWSPNRLKLELNLYLSCDKVFSAESPLQSIACWAACYQIYDQVIYHISIYLYIYSRPKPNGSGREGVR
jgi:hypothetical protein